MQKVEIEHRDWGRAKTIAMMVFAMGARRKLVSHTLLQTMPAWLWWFRFSIAHPRHPAPSAHRAVGKHSRGACCQDGLGAMAAEDALMAPMAQLVLAAWCARGPARGWGMHWLREPGRTGRPGACQRGSLLHGGSQQKSAVLWQEHGTFVVVCSEGLCATRVIIKDLLLHPKCIHNSWYSESLRQYCFYICGITPKQLSLKYFPIAFTDNKREAFWKCSSTNHFKLYFKLAALPVITIFLDSVRKQ